MKAVTVTATLEWYGHGFRYRLEWADANGRIVREFWRCDKWTPRTAIDCRRWLADLHGITARFTVG